MKIALLGVLVVVPIALLGVFLFASFMHVADVTVEGLTTLAEEDVRGFTQEQLEHRIAFVIPGTHIMLGRHEAIAEKLAERFAFAEVNVVGQGRTLRVTVRERISEIAWLAGEKTYLLDLGGIAVREASPEAVAMLQARLAQATDVPHAPGMQPTMPILADETNAEVTVGTPVLSAEVVEDVLLLDELLRTRALLPVRFRFEKSTSPWLTVDVASGPAMLFDLVNGEPATAVGYLDAYLAEQQPDLAQLLTIDLRFDNHLYTQSR